MRPIYDMLFAAANRSSFHMPGHKGRAPFAPVDAYALDTTETPLSDDLYAPERGVDMAQRLYAQSAGAARTLLLTNGSTSGIHVMMQLYAREGDMVLLPRNAHLSAVNGCIMGGVKVRWLPVSMTADGLCYLKEADVIAAMDEHPQAKALLLTRPDYYGCCVELTRIAAAAHARGMRVVVDEAHGAHFPWSAEMKSAGACGADAWVQSVHKTLPGLTGSAVLHLKEETAHARALRLLRREQTSSPSFIQMMSIDDARAYMQRYGAERLAMIADAADEVRRALPSLGYRDAHEMWQDTGLTFDRTRLVIDAPQGGAALAESLLACGVDVEMHDLRRAVFILSAMDEAEHVQRLISILKELPPRKADIPQLPMLAAIPERAMEVRQAAMAECESVPLAECAGRIAAAPAGLYPPGVPLVCPGEVITAEIADRLINVKNQERFGVEGDALLCVSV
ncbi:MAG: aminotransferase class I/II-fold pyridoxal phosphate-dependent enzyme [Clostridia bacterium]|nr:aminotransferase class I/II-fold pyridoxal phosphate-dependent enzyme [Clostridia bacterium]